MAELIIGSVRAIALIILCFYVGSFNLPWLNERQNAFFIVSLTAAMLINASDTSQQASKVHFMKTLMFRRKSNLPDVTGTICCAQ